MTSQTEASDRHLREIELADYLYGSLNVDAEKQIRLHLDTCAACSELTNSAALALPEMNSAGATTQGPALPEVFRQALESKQFASPDEGQLWRLRGPGEQGEVAVLGAIVRREDDHVWVVPVTPDPQEATDLWAVQLRIANTDLVMAFWSSLSTPVGYEVLDVWLGWTDVQPLKELLAAQRRGEEPPFGFDLGRQLDEELAAYRADLGVEFLQLQEARLVPDSGGDQVTSGGDVAEVLTAAGWAPSQLKAVAGDLTSGEAGDVLSGNRQLTDDQLTRVSDALGRSLAAVPTTVDWRWARAVGYPTRRHRYERLAALTDEDSWQFRRGIASQPTAVAARKSEGTIADWDQLAEQQLLALERVAEL
ncbi:hypothetical protein acdb102_21560 [Acidothermaceae bacterium B102]|nr:hypothetical protein acdb102_21560 [Acidothermaceae bacterium B102]